MLAGCGGAPAREPCESAQRWSATGPTGRGRVRRAADATARVQASARTRADQAAAVRATGICAGIASHLLEAATAHRLVGYVIQGGPLGRRGCIRLRHRESDGFWGERQHRRHPEQAHGPAVGRPAHTKSSGGKRRERAKRTGWERGQWLFQNDKSSWSRRLYMY